jgi:hypothetical protein
LARCISKHPWLHIPDEMPILREPSNHLPPGYRLEHDADVLVLRHSSDGSFVGAFSARGVSEQAVLRSVEDDRSGQPAYTGPQEHADSVRRMVKTRLGSSWERFLCTERRLLEARTNGQLARALARRLPTETREELDRMISEDRRTAEDGLVTLMSEESKLSYKHIEELSTEDCVDRIRAELARIEWLMERQGRRNIILRSDSSKRHQSRKSLGYGEAFETRRWDQAPWRNLQASVWKQL